MTFESTHHQTLDRILLSEIRHRDYNLAREEAPKIQNHTTRYLVMCLYDLLNKGIDLWEHFPHLQKYLVPDAEDKLMKAWS